jgi:hypothetical protein
MTTPLPDCLRRCWAAVNTPLEGCEPSFYLDQDGLVTIAIGNAVESLAAALALPLLTPSGAPASAGQIEDDYRRVRAMPPDLVAARYRAPTGLHLDAAGISLLVDRQLDANHAVLVAFWPNLLDYPIAAVAALHLLAWAVGPGASASGLTGASWPNLHNAVAARRWDLAAIVGWLRVLGNPGVAPRNLVVAACFWMATDLDMAAAQARAGIRVGANGLPTHATALASLAALDLGP